MVSLALHNMLRTKSSESYTPAGLVDFEILNGNLIQGEWHECSIRNFPLFDVKTVEDKVYLESKFDKNCVIVLMDQVKSHGSSMLIEEARTKISYFFLKCTLKTTKQKK